MIKMTCAAALERLFEEDHHSVHVDDSAGLQVVQLGVRVFWSLRHPGNLRRKKTELSRSADALKKS